MLGALTAYLLRTNSPCLRAGLDLKALFGIEIGKRDFYGQPLPASGGNAIGASVRATDE